MGEITGISWCDHTHNIAWGCEKVSPGCKFCYADTQSGRFGFDIWGATKPRRTLSIQNWNKPLKWNREAQKEGKKHKVFSSSMCDNFEDHPTIIEELEKLWPLIRKTPWLEWQLLTKRADRIRESLPDDWGVDGYPNVWLGVSVENNNYNWRAEELKKVPAKIKFISYEPALGPVDDLDLNGIDWLIFGGESGPNFRSMDSDWARNVKTKCEKSGTVFFYKQTAALKSGTDPYLDGVEYKNFPKY